MNLLGMVIKWITRILAIVVLISAVQAQNNNVPQLLLPGAVFPSLVQFIPCLDLPSTSISCSYPSIPQTGSPVTWTCPPGSFCQSPKTPPVPCTPGFYCPGNSMQPLYCPGGFYCSRDTKTIKICPPGYFCPTATITPVSCSFLAYCPAGTSSAPKIGILVFFILFSALIVYLFELKKKYDRIKRLSEKSFKVWHSYFEDRPTLKRLSNTFDIEFVDLSLSLPSGITIMSGVSGALRAGRTCAVMGPSGCGKSTFLTLLMGKVKRTTGRVFINGTERELSHFKKLIGYVPQEDIMLRELTVLEILMHSASMRLPASYTRGQVSAKVYEIIQSLGLGHVMHSVIGDEQQRGISGGQRKRVNIGMELVAEPSLLFLDEPTSGLDSCTAFDLCSNLKRIAVQQGLTVAAVIHSPSPATFREFDDLILLGQGGRVCFSGPRDRATTYFASVGFLCPSGDSESDFFMDVVSGKIPSAYDARFQPDDLFRYWFDFQSGVRTFAGRVPMNPHVAYQKKLEYLNAPIIFPSTGKLPGVEVAGTAASKSSCSDYVKWSYWKPAVNRTLSQTYSTVRDAALSIHTCIVEILVEMKESMAQLYYCITGQVDPIRQTIFIHRQLYLLLLRASSQVYRDAKTFIMELLLHLGCGTFISIAIQNFTYIIRLPTELCVNAPAALNWQCSNAVDNLPQAGMFIALGILFAGISVGAQTFGREKVVYWRDTSTGMSTTAYFFAKFITDIPRIILSGIMFAIALILFYPYQQSFASLLGLIILLYFVAYCMGYFIGIYFPITKASLIGTGFALLWALVLSGVIPSLDTITSDNSYSSILWLWDISAPRWGIEAFWLKEIEARQGGQSVQPANTYMYSQYVPALEYVLLIGFLWFKLAFLALKFTNRSQQK